MTQTATPSLYDDKTGLPVVTPSDLDYRTVETCDMCKVKADGTMYHSAGATGRVCEVLFLCDGCGGSPNGKGA